MMVRAVLLGLAGLLIAAGERRAGPIFLILSTACLIGLQDYALLNDLVKPAPKTKAFKYSDLARHVSVIGGALFIMATEEPVAPVQIKKGKKKN
jgi:hypothetical protein